MAQCLHIGDIVSFPVLYGIAEQFCLEGVEMRVNLHREGFRPIQRELRIPKDDGFDLAYFGEFYRFEFEMERMDSGI